MSSNEPDPTKNKKLKSSSKQDKAMQAIANKGMYEPCFSIKKAGFSARQIKAFLMIQ